MNNLAHKGLTIPAKVYVCVSALCSAARLAMYLIQIGIRIIILYVHWSHSQKVRRGVSEEETHRWKVIAIFTSAGSGGYVAMNLNSSG